MKVKLYKLLLFILLLSISSCIFDNDNSKNNPDDNKTVSSEFLSGLMLLPQEQYANLSISAPSGDIGILPSSVDLTNSFPKPGKQGSQGSCVGWALSYVKTYHEYVEKRWSLNDDYHIMSPAFIYNQIKLGDCESGSYIHDALNLLETAGCASLATMPYNQFDCSSQPSSAAFQEAYNYRISLWSRINQGSIQEMKGFIANNKQPLIVAIKVLPDFDALNENNPIFNDISGDIRNYHAIVIIGYDDAKSAFKFINSWGTDWGINGYGWISYDIVLSVIAQGYVAYDDKGNSPELKNGSVSPSTGNSSTTFTYKVDYYDEDKDTPTEIKVYIDGVGHDMKITLGEGWNGTYQYQTTLPSGSHKYYFWTNDGTHIVRLPNDNIFSGPNIETVFTISGRIYGASNVTVTLSGSASDSQTVISSGGSYSFTVAEGGTYTVTPSKSGYSFSPTSKTFTNISSNQSQNFTGPKNVVYYTISGTVTGASGVVVNLSGSATDSQTVSSSGGSYSFTVPEGGTYTVTPSKSGYSFSPTSKTFTNISSNQSQNFTGTKNVVYYTISGTVTGASGVVVNLSGSASDSQTVSSSGGSYSFTVAEGGTYTVTPSKSGYSFSPTSKTFTNISSNQSQNFTVVYYTISGTITGASGVVVNLSGSATDSQTVSSSGGSYSFTVPGGGTYTVTPSKSGYSFTPTSKTFSNIPSNQNQDFTGKEETYLISGRTYGAAGVYVQLTGVDTETRTTYVSNTGGNYFFTVAAGGTYTITPSKSGYSFTPTSKTFSNISSNQNQDFKGVPLDNPWETVGINYATIPSGSFSMGSNLFDDDETPVHTVTLSGFEMGIYEVTQGQYRSENPSYNVDDEKLPVEKVSWSDAIKFCNALSEKAGLDKCYNESTGSCDFSKNGFRLPTEAEWEYACRAGTTTKYYMGDSESDLASAGWYSGNSSDRTHFVGQKTKNAWGLYDMHGNVREWCYDWYDSNYYGSSPSSNPIGPASGSQRMLRGGSYNSDARYCAYSRRDPAGPDFRTTTVGFRVVRRP